MDLKKISLVVSVASLLAAATPVLAEDNGSGPDDSTGMSSLGVDISRAGSSPAAIQEFLAGLPPDGQRSVLNGCQTAVSSGGSGYAPAVIGFCQAALDVGRTGPALGFAQEPSFGFVPSPIQNPNVTPNPTLPLGEPAAPGDSSNP